MGKLSGAVSLISVILFLMYILVEKIVKKKELSIKIQTLPNAPLVDLDSVAYNLPSSSTIVLIHFNSSCDHCKYELREIKEKLSAFADTPIVLMSSENLATIKKTAIDFDIDSLPNVHFAKINAEHVFDTFGSLFLPHIFIYGKDRKLIKEFKGEAKVEAIVKYLP